MFNGNSPSLADIAAVTGNNKDGWGDGNGWWVLIILFAIFGGWGNGFGGGYGNGGDRASVPCATQADVRSAVDQQTLISKLDQQTYGLADSNYALNNTINSNFVTPLAGVWIEIWVKTWRQSKRNWSLPLRKCELKYLRCICYYNH